MSDFKAKMHQIQFRLRLRPRPRWGSLNAPPGPLAAIVGVLLLREGEREGKRREERGGGKGGEEKEEREEGKGAPHFLLTTLTTGQICDHEIGDSTPDQTQLLVM